MKTYKLKYKGLFGTCKHCLQPLIDEDVIWGEGYCQKCNIRHAKSNLAKLIMAIEKDIKV